MRFVFCLVFLALSTQAFAEETWRGFRPVEKTTLPFKDYLENSVVLIDTVGDDVKLKETAVEVIDISKIKPVTDAKRLAPGSNPTKVQTNLRAIQIETCRKQGLKFCPVMKISSMSTGFFEDGKKLNTCRHAFHNWLVWASRANGNVPVETLSPPMILYSKDRKVLYNSATVPKDQLLKFSFLNTDPQANFLLFKPPKAVQDNWLAYASIDVAQLQAPTNIVPPQPVTYGNINVLSASAPVYVAGYPGKTHYFSSGKGDAPGGRLVVSVGAILKIHFEDQIVVTDNLTKTGLSGGPLLDEYGDVIGISCYGYSPSKIDHFDDVGAYSIFPNRPALKDHWSKLKY